MHTADAECTANFVFTNGTDVYLGQAAHCSGTGGQTATSGCTSESLPLGTPVKIQGASKPGTLVYNSWLAMQRRGETNPDACEYNDLALVKVDPADVGSTNPTIPVFGGPTGLHTGSTRAGGAVFGYGNSVLRLGVPLLLPSRGLDIKDSGGGWSHTVYSLPPGLPGDSGGGVLAGDGTALGVLSTFNVLPEVASNGVGDLARELAYATDHGALGEIMLVPGTNDFHPPPL